VVLEPAAVVVEILADGADQDRAETEHAHAEADVARHSPTPDVELFDDEGQGDLVQLVDDQRVGEPPRVLHQMVCRDRAGYGDLHGGQLLGRGQDTAESFKARAPIPTMDARTPAITKIPGARVTPDLP
jgi:hypothetical protein